MQNSYTPKMTEKYSRSLQSKIMRTLRFLEIYKFLITAKYWENYSKIVLGKRALEERVRAEL